MALSGKVCIVTGATRGIGKGIALQLGEAGATVYITGRTLKSRDGSKGSLEDTTKEIEDRGGKCIPIQCDHSKDEDIELLFKRVKEEQNGRLDLLVNNAYSGVKLITDSIGKKFWELPVTVWDDINHVGLRNHYICTVYATRMMLDQGGGLILWVSSGGGLGYLFNTAYGVGKAAVDRMAADCAFELRKKNISCISLYPGLVRTDNMLEIRTDTTKISSLIEYALKTSDISESEEFSGKAVVHLLKDKNIKHKSGRIVMTGDLADEYGFVDIDGKKPYGLRNVAGYVTLFGYTKIAWFIPRWLKIPKWVLTLVNSKF